jgi:hypothetical protein
MATVRCPKCGAINADGRRRLARCGRCREWLGKCRYCKHYDRRLGDCTSLSRRTDDRVLDADEVLNCPDFSSGLVVGAGAAARRFRPRLLWLVGVALLVGAMAVSLLRGPPGEPAASVLRVAVDSPSSIVEDEVLEITVLVSNLSKQPAREVKVIISGKSVASLVCQYVTPEEAFLEATPKVVTAALGDMDPGAIQSVTFRFLPRRSGNFELTVVVSAANLDIPNRTPVECQVLP